MRTPAALVTILLLSLVPDSVLHAQTGPDDPARVLVVYRANAADTDGNGISDSLDIATLYAARRGIPPGNLLGVTCSPAGSGYSLVSGWTTCWNEVVNPIRTRLSQLGPTSIDMIVLCHRLPWRLDFPDLVPGDPTRSLDQIIATIWYALTPASPGITTYWYGNTYHEPSPTVGIDKGRFTHANSNFINTTSYLVCRIDGPDLQSSKDLVDRAWYADTYVFDLPGHYNGRAYVDTRFQLYTDAYLIAGYPFGYNAYADGDRSMAFAKIVCQMRGYAPYWEPFETEIGEASALFSDATSAAFAPRALFYGGWYNYNTYHDGWEWLPGSVACDVDSNSGANPWNPSPANFLPSAFLRGLTCGAGCIAEPYLSGHPRPEVLLHYILGGFTFAEAAMLSDPTARWTSIYLGDGMYNPFRQGKIPALDVADPAIGEIRILRGPLGTDRTIRLTLADAGAPEVVVASVNYGPTQVPAVAAGGGSRWSRRPEIVLPGLPPSSVIRFVATVTDPVSRTATSPLHFTFTETPAPTLARALPSSQSVTAGNAADITLVHARTDVLDPILAATLLLDAPALGVTGLDVTAAVPALATETLTSPDFTEFLVRLTIPTAGLPPGTYTLALGVQTVSGQASAAASFDVTP